MRVGLAADIEAVGIGALFCIAVRRADHGEYQLACGDRLPVHFDVLTRVRIIH
jgi:hypothetical protein